MSWWITVYCRRDCGSLNSGELARGIRDGDLEAPAGVDYHTLAEDYDVREALVAPALRHLRVTEDLEVHYAPNESARPVVVHVWAAPERVREEVEEAHEVRDAPAEASPYLEDCRAVVAIELGSSMAETMGVVLAYEVARYVAQKYDGIVVDDDDSWQRIHEGEFTPVGAS
jgi:hypothetical protein